jgi:hypothetical protein
MTDSDFYRELFLRKDWPVTPEKNRELLTELLRRLEKAVAEETYAKKP